MKRDATFVWSGKLAFSFFSICHCFSARALMIMMMLIVIVVSVAQSCIYVCSN